MTRVILTKPKTFWERLHPALRRFLVGFSILSLVCITLSSIFAGMLLIDAGHYIWGAVALIPVFLVVSYFLGQLSEISKELSE